MKSSTRHKGQFFFQNKKEKKIKQTKTKNKKQKTKNEPSGPGITSTETDRASCANKLSATRSGSASVSIVDCELVPPDDEEDGASSPCLAISSAFSNAFCISTVLPQTTTRTIFADEIF